MDGKRLIHHDDFEPLLGLKISKSTIRRTPDFPKPVELSKQIRHYVYDEVVAWIDARIAARGDKAAA